MSPTVLLAIAALALSAGAASSAPVAAPVAAPVPAPVAAPASAQVPHVTVVLGATDFAAMVALFDTFTGLPATGCPSSPATP